METLSDIKKNYLIGNKLFLKEKINIECAISHDGLLSYSNIHTCVELEGSIDIISIDSRFIFKSMNKTFIYWCDVCIFAKLKCKHISDFREDILNEILK
jgi:hypothetical protein